MSKERLVAFSDGVIAVIITIMVLEIKAPHASTWQALSEIRGAFLAYVLSFAFVGIYWNNHHHLFTAVRKIDGRVMWCNLFLLFWLSLVPVATAWRGEAPDALAPDVLFGALLLACGLAYTLLVRAIVASSDANVAVANAVGNNPKGKLSMVVYVLGIAAAWVSPILSDVAYVIVAAMWFIPDRRIVRELERRGDSDDR